MELSTQLRELRDKHDQASNELMEIVSTAETEDRNLTEDESERHDQLETDLGDYHARMKRIEKRLGVNEYSPNINDEFLTPKEAKRFSLRKLVRALAEPGERGAQEAAAFEVEACQEVRTLRKSEPRGHFIPTQVWEARRRQLAEQRATHVAATPNAVGDLIAEELLADEFIELLRNRSFVVEAGATQLPNLVGDIAIPKQTAASTAEWQATETTDITESNVTVGLVRLSPKTVGVHTSISRQALIQTTPAIDRLLENDMRRQVALAVDAAAAYGTGAAGQPTGITGTAGIGTAGNFAGVTPTWVELMAMVREAAVDNALVSLGGDSNALGNQTVKWAVNGGVGADLMAVEKFAGTGMTIVDSSGRIGPWSALASQQVVDGDVFFADWSQLLLGTWGGIDLIVDPYSQSQRGVVRMTIFQSVDVGVRHPEAFVFGNDGV